MGSIYRDAFFFMLGAAAGLAGGVFLMFKATVRSMMSEPQTWRRWTDNLAAERARRAWPLKTPPPHADQSP